MTPERFRQIESLVSLVQDRMPPERVGFLDVACAGDQELRERVEAILRAEEHLDGFLERPPPEFIAEVLETEAGKIRKAESSDTSKPSLGRLPTKNASVESAAAPRILNDRYVTERELGRGGMGRVLVARDMKLDRRVAIKILVAGTHDEQTLHRFEQEARAAGSLNHPNVLVIHDIGSHEGQPYIVSELLEGGTLRERLTGTPLPMGAAIDYALQLAEGLGAAHSRGIVHRDLKPENLFITEDGRLKILDFGIAKLTAPKTSSADLEERRQTQTGTILGTIGYMSPEQVRGQPADHRSDIFSSGVILYEMLSGKRAFEADSSIETAYAILNTEPPELPDSVPVAVEEIVRRCLKKKPEERFQSARELALELSAILAAPTRSGEPFAARAAPLVSESCPNNLPMQPAPILGREQEIKAVRNRLLHDGVRLLTLTGPGGTGKTRLALEVAVLLLRDFADGVLFVSLEPLRDPQLVASTIAQVLRIGESAGQPLVGDLKDNLRQKTLLLVLDNCEQVLDAAPLVVDLLAACPKLKVLATSRVRLHVRPEQEFPVPPLALPDRQQPPPLERLQDYGAVALFIQRARAVKPGFAVTQENAAAVVEICHRLDGLPLAIELAAARSKILSPQAMVARLEHRLSLLTGGPRDLPSRHQTLRAAIDWSYQLLTTNEQMLFRRLAVFVAGFTLEAAEAVCGAAGAPTTGDLLDCLSTLVDSNLLRQEEQSPGEPRFFLLETIREYSLERLVESGEANPIREQHASFYLALTERAAPQLFGPQQVEWLRRAEQEHDNLRAALGWFEEQRQVESGLRLAEALSWFWSVRGHLTEARERLARILSLETPDAASGPQAAARAKALYMAGRLAIHQGDHRAARQHLEESLAIQRERGDKGAIFSVLAGLGAVAMQQREYSSARAYSEEMLAIGKEWRNYEMVCHAVMNLGNLAHEQKDYAAARSFHQKSLAIKRKMGNKVGIFVALHSLGMVAQDQGDLDAARSFFEQSLAVTREIEDPRGSALSLAKLGEVATAQHDHEVARSCLEESLTISQARGDKGAVAFAMERLVGLASARSQPSRALRLAGAATALREGTGAPVPPDVRAELEQRLEPARQALSAATAATDWAEGHAMSLAEAIAYAMSREAS